LLAQLWLYVTPVVYPLDTVPDRLRPFYLANPMTGLIESFRDVLINGHAPDPGLLTPSIVGTVLVFVLGAWYFNATEPRFADVI
jgi:lipopolysaccharide transport system permease protein